MLWMNGQWRIDLAFIKSRTYLSMVTPIEWNEKFACYTLFQMHNQTNTLISVNLSLSNILKYNSFEQYKMNWFHMKWYRNEIFEKIARQRKFVIGVQRNVTKELYERRRGRKQTISTLSQFLTLTARPRKRREFLFIDRSKSQLSDIIIVIAFVVGAEVFGACIRVVNQSIRSKCILNNMYSYQQMIKTDAHTR